MKILIDTHIAIWAVLNDPKLPKRAKNIILDEANEIFYSTASVWEITIKHMLHFGVRNIKTFGECSSA